MGTFKIADHVNAADLATRAGRRPPMLVKPARTYTVPAAATFVYERDMEGRDLPAPMEPENTRHAAQLADAEPDWRFDLEGNAGAAFGFLAVDLMAALPSDRALDTSFLLLDGGHVLSWRARLGRDLVQIADWQIGHADEAETFAADELLAAHRAFDKTEIAQQRIDTAETRVRQAEARAVHWRKARAGMVDGFRTAGYPTTMPTSGFGVADRLALTFRTFQNAMGSPEMAFLAHRMLWSIVRLADRGIASVQRRWKKAQSNREAARDCRAQLRAYALIRDTAAEAYAAATGDAVAFQAGRQPADAPTLQDEIVAWLAKDRRNARAFAR